MPALGPGRWKKAPKTQSLGARPRLAWAGSLLPSTPLGINMEVRCTASLLLKQAMAQKEAEGLERKKGEPGPRLGVAALGHLLFWY